jgi:hypothetical protein
MWRSFSNPYLESQRKVVFETEIDSPREGGSRKLTLRYYAVWLAGMLAVCIGGAFLFWYFSWNDAQVGKRERTAVGTVTSLGSAARGGTANCFRFSFGGTTYDGTESQSEYRPGEIVVVYFDPNNPSNSSLTEYSISSKMKHNFMMALFLVSIGMALVLVHLVRELPADDSAESEGANN